MKNHPYILKNRRFIGALALSFGLLATGLTSCDLVEYNPSGTTADIVFSTPEGYEKLINAIYVNYRKEIYGREDVMFMTEGGTDLWHNAAFESYNTEFTEYKNLNEIKPQLKNFWNRNYEPINLCNAAINRVEDAGYGNDTARRDAKVAEAHFFRAFSYWHLVETFGGVTLKTTETSGPILNQYRSPISAFYQLITSDLEFAVKHLPVVQADKGRVCRKAAYHMLSRAYLTMANYCQLPDSLKEHLDCTDMTPELATGYFQKAYDAAKYLLDNQAALGASLYPTFPEVFLPANNKTNTEALMVVTHSATDALNPQPYPNRLFMWYQAVYDNYCGVTNNLTDGYASAHMMPTYYLLSLFNEDMDARYYGSFKEKYKCNFVQTSPRVPNRLWTAAELKLFNKAPSVTTTTKIPRDSVSLWFTKKVVPNKATISYCGVIDINDTYRQYRLAQGDTRHYINRDSTGINKFFPSLIKFADPDRSDASSSIGKKDVIVMRLGETYLLAAEAAFGLNRKQEASDLVNVLRRRATIHASDTVAGRMLITADSISVNFFLEERARELCGEHLRWYDLKRYGKLHEQIYKGNPDISLFQTKHILRPIPQAELETLLNGDEYGQNKGY